MHWKKLCWALSMTLPLHNSITHISIHITFVFYCLHPVYTSEFKFSNDWIIWSTVPDNIVHMLLSVGQSEPWKLRDLWCFLVPHDQYLLQFTSIIFSALTLNIIPNIIIPLAWSYDIYLVCFGSFTWYQCEDQINHIFTFPLPANYMCLNHIKAALIVEAHWC